MKKEGKDTTSDSAAEAFEVWRKTTKDIGQNWGLAWFLANEFCERFYSSHGIVPHVIEHDGLGYYGIQLNPIPCAVNGPKASPLGRMTMFGNVENWCTGNPGDHGLDAIRMCQEGESTSAIVEKAIIHMQIPPYPEKSHARCRHKRHGTSYELLFRVATIIALRGRGVAIWNEPELALHRGVPKNLAFDPGVFYFLGPREVAITGDGRMMGTDENLWLNYMRGKSVGSIVDFIETALAPSRCAE